MDNITVVCIDASDEKDLTLNNLYKVRGTGHNANGQTIKVENDQRVMGNYLAKRFMFINPYRLLFEKKNNDN